MTSRRHPSTRAAQALGWVDPITGGVVPAIHPSVPYVRSEDGKPAKPTYTRDHNPTYDQAEALLADLEHGSASLLFSSGMSAATTVFETLAIGDHVVAPQQMYWTIRRWLQKLAEQQRIILDLVPNGDLKALEDVVQPGKTKVVWIETPANPSGAITDIRPTAAIAHAAGAHVVVDSTVVTPVLCRPLELGADLVMHSATKQLNGHADVLAGALVTAREDEFWERCCHERAHRGAVLGPFESWLLLRGMRTVFLRVTRSVESALRIAEAVRPHAAVLEVLYPGLPSHPGHDVAVRQMEGGFGMIVSLRLRGGFRAAQELPRTLELFQDATSLGGVESLAEHRSPVEGEGTPVPDDLVRLSVGIEDADDLIADLLQGLNRLIPD